MPRNYKLRALHCTVRRGIAFLAEDLKPLQILFLMLKKCVWGYEPNMTLISFWSALCLSLKYSKTILILSEIQK